MFETAAQAFERLPLADRLASPYKKSPGNGMPLDKKGNATWPPKWGQWKSIKKRLLAISRNKCSYCESASGGDQHGQVEHYKPKSIFPTGAYDWDNYLYSCEKCNHSKSNKWPETGAYVRPDVLGFDPDVFTFADDGTIDSTDRDGKATIADFGLDRDGLVASRQVLIEAALADVANILKLVDALGLAPPDRRVYVEKKLARPEMPYSAAINAAVRRAWAAAFPGEPPL